MIVVNPTGGGLSGGKLAQASATPADVLSGKTFFAGGKDIKTGTFDLSLANATVSQVLNGYKFYAGNSTLKIGTLVPKGKTASGTFPGFDGDSISINLGFNPLLVVVYNGSFSRDFMIAFSYNDNSKISGVYRKYGSTSTYTISGAVYITPSGFEAVNVDFGPGDTPGVYSQFTTLYYYAVG